MRYVPFIVIVGWLACARCAWGQGPGKAEPTPLGGAPAPATVGDAGHQSRVASVPKSPTLQDTLEQTAREIKALKEEHAREVQRQQKQAENQQKQIEVLERTARLLAEQIKKQSTSSAVVESLDSKTAVLEARSKKAAQRDEELANEAGDLREKLDVQARRTQLPYTAKELFLPTQTNETPLAIYGQILGGYSRLNGRSGLFQSPSFGPWVLLQLNQRFLLEVNFDISTAGVGLGQAQLDWFINNWLTLSAGRFLTPIGSFNERLSPEWINKLPDAPVMFRQVVPQTSTDGIQLRGSRYLGGLPLKVEYSAYAGNGFLLGQKPMGLTPISDLGGITGGPDEVSAAAYGGRVGLWAPIQGVNFGLSGYTNGVYSPGSRNHYALWDFDFNYHKGNWDFRAEYANTYQEATSFVAHNINRSGLYTQLAYRDYQAKHPFFQNLEYVGRYGFADFHGINPGSLDQTAFATPFDIPVSRSQYTLGVNYYFYPSMVLKLAYEINREHNLRLNDNVFLAQGVWAF